MRDSFRHVQVDRRSTPDERGADLARRPGAQRQPLFRCMADPVTAGLRPSRSSASTRSRR